MLIGKKKKASNHAQTWSSLQADWKKLLTNQHQPSHPCLWLAESFERENLEQIFTRVYLLLKVVAWTLVAKGDVNAVQDFSRVKKFEQYEKLYDELNW